MPYPDQSALATETTTWFNDYYKLAPGTFNVGKDAVLNTGWTLLLDEYEYFVGTYGDDKGANALRAVSKYGWDVLDGPAIMNGGFGDDEIIGSRRGDLLDGDEGDDTLNGGQGDDYLFGAKGADTYIVGENKDILRDDEDGQGSVRTTGGYVFTGGTQINANAWKSADGSVTYIRSGNQLKIVKDGNFYNRTTIEAFDFAMASATDYLGIHLQKKDEDDGPGAGGPGGGGAGGAAGDGISWTRKRDPLVLDLDGDGIELTTSSAAVLFDHNADGIKTGTQWVKADDGILVRDLNGNGTVDSGRELMGDQTIITTLNAQGQSISTLAANGFEALRALDADALGDANGMFDANDVAYGELKVWRDLNQDGVSQANELQTLADAGVTAINLTQTPTQVTQGKSSFTKTVAGVDANGDPLTISTEQTVQNINFRENAFVRAFADDPAITTEAAALPQMQGAGLVRDLGGSPKADKCSKYDQNSYKTRSCQCIHKGRSWDDFLEKNLTQLINS